MSEGKPILSGAANCHLMNATKFAMQIVHNFDLDVTDYLDF